MKQSRASKERGSNAGLPSKYISHCHTYNKPLHVTDGKQRIKKQNQMRTSTEHTTQVRNDPLTEEEYK